MTVYVDEPSTQPAGIIGEVQKHGGNLRAHLWADDGKELVLFAARLGLPDHWYRRVKQFECYMIPPITRKAAIYRGAKPISLEQYFVERKRK